MKRLIYAVIFLLVLSANAFAAWTPRATVKQFGESSVQVEIVFVCDGSASGTLNLNTILSASDFAIINGAKLYSVSVIPGTGTVAPDGAYDVNIYNSAGTQTIDATTTSASSIHTYNTYESTGIIQQIMGSVPFDVGDIGTSGDQVTLQFNCSR